MIDFDFERLRSMGLTPALASRATACASEPPLAELACRLMRLTVLHRETLRLHDGETEISARVMPRLARALFDAEDSLAVGDWVLCVLDAHGAAWVHERVPPSDAP
jgi:ribosome biogenesis GTPase